MEQWEKLPHHHLVMCRRGHPINGMHYFSALCLKEFCAIRAQSLDLPFVDPEKQVTSSSCGGLLYIGVHFSSDIFIVNPTTQKFKWFSDNKRGMVIGGSLGYDSKCDEYKIVRVHVSFGAITADLYSLKTNQGWKDIEYPPGKYRPHSHVNIYVAATGKSYWLARSGNKEVLSFDFTAEKFSFFPLPPLP